MGDKVTPFFVEEQRRIRYLAHPMRSALNPSHWIDGFIMPSFPSRPTTLRIILPVTLALLLGTAAKSLAVPFHSPLIDGTITADGTDWDPADLVVNDRADDNTSRSGNIRNLWCTWDEDNLYLAVTYQDFGPDEALAIYVDLDKSAGPRSATDLDTYPGNFTLPDDSSIDLVLGRGPGDSADVEGGPPPGVRLVNDNTGTTVDISELITSIQAFSVGKEAGALPFWFNAEFALPWSVIYPDGLPSLAVLKAVAIITKSSADLNGIDSAPDNPGLDGGSNQVALLNLSASILDFDGDGTPDPATGSIAGTVTLPGDDGTTAIAASASIIDFAGRDPGAELSRVTTEPGLMDYTLPRLPDGAYTVLISAEGYLPTTVTATISGGTATTGVDVTLESATAIRGDISFASGSGNAGTITLLDGAGTVLQTWAFTASGGPYVFYVDSGQYTVRAEAETYLTAEIPVTLTAGTDVTGVDFNLQRQTEISGTVSFASGPGAAGTLRLLDADDHEIDFADFPANGGSFAFFTATGGDFSLSASAPTYITTRMSVSVTTGVNIEGLEVILPRAAHVAGTIGFEGPVAAGRLELRDELTGVLRDTSSFAAPGDSFAFFLEPGAYRLHMTASGYVPLAPLVEVGLDDVDLGRLTLLAVRADHLEIVDDQGTTLSEVRGTVSIPEDQLWFPTKVSMAARDAAGRDDLYDLDNNLTGFVLSALKMDDLSPSRGTPTFFASADLSDTTATVDFQGSRSEFWMTNTAVEVLRVYLAQPAKDPIAGRIVVAFQDPQPTTVVLTAAADSLLADGLSTVTVTAQLFDSARNPSRLADIPVTFAVSPSSSGAGRFAIPTVTTNADGQAQAQLSATGSGTVLITASVVVNNRVLTVVAEDLDSGLSLLPLITLPGPPLGWHISLPSNLSDLISPLTVGAQLVDAFGNPSPVFGQPFTFTADPAGLGTFDPASATSDSTGRATSVFTPTGSAGLVTLSGQGGSLAVQNSGLRLRDVFVISDPDWQQELRTRQTFPPTDLTALVVDNNPDLLKLDIPFASDWSGLQLHVIFETDFDAAGASRDPFGQPVNYGHDLKPDFAITCKYSADDYGDFRRWNKSLGAWEWYDPDTETFTTQGFNIQNLWTTKSGDAFQIEIPWAAFDGQPDSLMLEVYLTQDVDGVKRSAFDSAPQDSTLNLTFDYTDPGPNDWDTTLGPVTLSAWGGPYAVKTDFPTPPVISDVQANPAQAIAGGMITLQAQVTDGGDGIGDVLADLSAAGGGALTRMFDDGQAVHGDQTAGDGIFSLQTLIPVSSPGGDHELTVNAFDGSNAVTASDHVTINVQAVVEPLLEVADPVGDDHGPNQPGTVRKFYTYPTNIVFGPGSYDLTGLTIYETTAMVGGQSIDMIAFQVALGDFPDPADPSTADWNPLYAELNIQKIDILIDSAPGGAIATLPNRQAAFQPWDAWDYAVIMDGWYKAIIPSLGQNTVDSWRENALRTDQDILLLGDPQLNTVTALVSRTALGDPTVEDILSWDIAVCLASHDFGGEEVLGGIRWVNEARSEWQFGGGQNSDRDSNLMDLLLIPGSGHQAGKTQEEILDYESPAALARLEQGLTPVAIEMSQFEDTGPPVIDTGGGDSVVTRILPLTNAPIAMTMRISDDNRVDHAEMRYRSSSFEGQGWDREVAMGSLGSDLWVVEILPSWLDSNLVYSPVDSSRYMEFEITATDAQEKVSVSPVTTLQIAPSASERFVTSALEGGDITLRQVDGSSLDIPDGLRSQLLANHIAETWTGPEVAADTMGSRVQVAWGLFDAPQFTKDARQVPPGQPLGVFREISVATSDTSGGYLDQSGHLPSEARLSLHYPQAWVPGNVDENKIGMYEYNPASNIWTLSGGSVTTTGNRVTTTITHTGTYGLFYTEGLQQNSGAVISGILVSPNPFSPNGDGLYDETTISFYLDREATVTVEIFNAQGNRKNVLQQTFYYSGDEQDGRVPHRVPGLVWNGRDFGGNIVPYGIYILRIETTYNQAGGTRTIRSNHSLAVIK